MNEAQERNLIRFILGNSITLDDMYEEYLGFCFQHGFPQQSKDIFGQTILKGGFRIVVLEEQAYVFGALRHGDTRPKPSVYVKNTPPIAKEEWDQWMDEHSWKPAF